jgi:hypothetical protein
MRLKLLEPLELFRSLELLRVLRLLRLQFYIVIKTFNYTFRFIALTVSFLEFNACKGHSTT